MKKNTKKFTWMSALSGAIFFFSASAFSATNFAVPDFPAPGFSVTPLDEMKLPDVMKGKIRENIEQRKKRGTDPTPDKQFTSLNHAVERIKQEKMPWRPLAEIVNDGTLISSPSSVVGTVLEHAELIFTDIGGMNKNSQWSGLTRIYKTKDLGIVKLSENSYRTVKLSMTISKESVNASVNGNPATLIAKYSTSGENYIGLVWATENKFYKLTSNASNLEQGKTALLDLAEAIKD